MSLSHHTHISAKSGPNRNGRRNGSRYFSLTQNDEDDFDPHFRPSSGGELNTIDKASRFISGVTFVVLLTLCINTFIDLRESTSSAHKKIQNIASSLRDEMKEKKAGLSLKGETFQLSDYYKIDEDTKVSKELSSVTYPKGGPVIVFLTTNTTKDIDDTQTALKSLIFLNGDNDPNHLAPVLIFNEGNINDAQKLKLTQSTNRPISFPVVDFNELPGGLDIEKDGMKFKVQGRENPWGYHQMIRFWITRIWHHPAVEPYEIIMRMDSDSCFKGVNEVLPGFLNDDIVYHSQFVGVESGSGFMEGLMDHSERFLKRYNKMAGNPMLYRYAKLTWETKKTLPLFMTNFEVSRKSWMLKNIVMRWHESLTEEKPYGVFTHRWGDAVTRFLMVAMIAMNYQLDTNYPDGYFHKAQCKREGVEQAIREYNQLMDAYN